MFVSTQAYWQYVPRATFFEKREICAWGYIYDCILCVKGIAGVTGTTVHCKTQQSTLSNEMGVVNSEFT